MPRAEVGTPKWLANKMKSKGLQRLRWYCQMCQKQCRDENGFKCHRMSEAHQRQMQIFAQRPGKYMDEFSRQFEATFMSLMRTRYCRARVLANTVYCDLIADKNHVHMNATIWSTLSEFVLYLKRCNKCNVEWSEEGWYMEYIDHERIEREKRDEEKRRQEVTAEQRRDKIMNRLIEKAWKDAPTSSQKEVVPFDRKEDRPLEFSVISATSSKNVSPEGEIHEKPLPLNLKLLSRQHEEQEEKQRAQDIKSKSVENSNHKMQQPSSSTKKLSALERLVLEQENRKRLRAAETDFMPSNSTNEHDQKSRSLINSNYSDQQRSRDHRFLNHHSDSRHQHKQPHSRASSKSPSVEKPSLEKKIVPSPKHILSTNHEVLDDSSWLAPNLIVRINNPKLAEGRYHRQKGRVRAVCDEYCGEIVMLNSGDVILLDQTMLEPVIPASNGNVMVIHGALKGQVGKVRFVNIEKEEMDVDFNNENTTDVKTLVLKFSMICKFMA